MATYSGQQINATISVAEAMAYINSEEEALALLQSDSYIGSLVKEPVRIGGKNSTKVSYRKTDFTDYTMGTYDSSKGYPDKNYSSQWVEKTLSESRGDVLTIDTIKDDASLGGDIVALYNKYSKQVKLPTIAKHTISKIIAGVKAVNKSTTTLTKANIVTTILGLLTSLEEKGVTAANAKLELRITPTAHNLLVEAGYDKGTFTLNGTPFAFTNEVSNINGVVSIVKVPSSIMGDASLILAPVDAIAVTFLLDEAVYRDSVPGHGTRKKQVEVGVVFDSWIVPGWEDYVFVNAKASS